MFILNELLNYCICVFASELPNDELGDRRGPLLSLVVGQQSVAEDCLAVAISSGEYCLLVIVL